MDLTVNVDGQACHGLGLGCNLTVKVMLELVL